MTAQREPHTELDVLTHFVPGSLTHLLIGDVQPNYNYSCMVSEQLDDSAQVLGNKVSEPFHFATDYIGESAYNRMTCTAMRCHFLVLSTRTA